MHLQTLCGEGGSEAEAVGTAHLPGSHPRSLGSVEPSELPAWASTVMCMLLLPPGGHPAHQQPGGPKPQALGVSESVPAWVGREPLPFPSTECNFWQITACWSLPGRWGPNQLLFSSYLTLYRSFFIAMAIEEPSASHQIVFSGSYSTCRCIFLKYK